MTSVLAGGLVLVVALLAVLVVGLLRSHAEILRALHELGVNLDPAERGATATGYVMPAPSVGGSDPIGLDLDLAGTTPGGHAQQVGVAGTRHRTLVAFLSSSCLTCRTFWDEFSAGELVVPATARLVIVTKGAEAESPSAVAELAPPHIPTILSTEAWDRYRVPGAPYFVVVDGPTSRVIGQGTAPTWARVSELLRRAIADNEAGPDREANVDAVLRAAGIGPDDPSLRPGPSGNPARP